MVLVIPEKKSSKFVNNLIMLRTDRQRQEHSPWPR